MPLLRLNPSDAGADYRRGLIYGMKGEQDKAVADFTEAIRLNPKHAGAYYNRGVAYREMDQQGKADANFAKAQRLEYELK
jgi:Flp pilus assembly protein TadD